MSPKKGTKPESSYANLEEISSIAKKVFAALVLELVVIALNTIGHELSHAIVLWISGYGVKTIAFIFPLGAYVEPEVELIALDVGTLFIVSWAGIMFNTVSGFLALYVLKKKDIQLNETFKLFLRLYSGNAGLLAILNSFPITVVIFGVDGVQYGFTPANDASTVFAVLLLKGYPVFAYLQVIPMALFIFGGMTLIYYSTRSP